MNLVEHIAVMMLIFIRSQMLQQDYSLCLRRLMKYPPVEDVHMFVSRAIESRKKPSAKFDFNQPIVHKSASTASLSSEDTKHTTSKHQRIPSGSLSNGKDVADPLSVGTKSNSVGTPSKTTSSQPAVSGRKMKFTPLASMLTSGFSSTAESKNASVKKSPNTLQEKQRRDMLEKPKVLSREELVSREEKLGESMHLLLSIVQSELFEKQKGEYNEDTILLALSKLKHIKDVLRYQLTLDENESKWVFDPNYLPVEVKPKAQDTKTQRKSVEIPSSLLPTLSTPPSEQKLNTNTVFPSTRDLASEDNTVSTEVLPEEVSTPVDNLDVNSTSHHHLDELIRPPLIVEETLSEIPDDPLQASSVSADFQEVNI